jgi:hypothetical protein
LVKETCNAPDFPRTQVPILAERNAASNTRIQLSKLSVDDGEPNSTESTRAFGRDTIRPLNPQYLSLRFAFDSKPSDNEINYIARSLSGLVKSHTLSARRIDWGGLRSSDMLKIAASKFRESGVRRKARRTSGASLNTPRSPVSPASDDRSSVLLSPTAIPRRQYKDNDGEVGRRSDAPESDRLPPNGARKLGGGQSSFETGRKKRRRAAGRSTDESDVSEYIVVVPESQE